MGLTQQQNIPNKPSDKSEDWSVRHLFSLSAMTTAFSDFVKSSNPFELFFGFMVFITGIGELLGSEFEWLWFVIMLLILGGAFYLRLLKLNFDMKEKKSIKRKTSN